MRAERATATPAAFVEAAETTPAAPPGRPVAMAYAQTSAQIRTTAAHADTSAPQRRQSVTRECAMDVHIAMVFAPTLHLTQRTAAGAALRALILRPAMVVTASEMNDWIPFTLFEVLID
jgi:hypothetical protein